MLIATLLATIGADRSKESPILVADSHFECTVGRKCFVLTRNGGGLLVPADRESIEPLRNTVKARDQVALDKMLQIGTAFRVASGMPVQILEQGPIVEHGQLMIDRGTSIVVPSEPGKRRVLYRKVRFLAGPARDRIALVAPENLGRLAEFKAVHRPRVRVADTPAHAAVAAFCHAADLDNSGNTADALNLYQAVLDEHPSSGAAILARERIRAIERLQ